MSNGDTVSALEKESLELYQNLQNNLTHQLESIQNNVTSILGPYTCGGTRGWRRVVYLDMTDSSTTCPSGWQLTGYSKRTCGKVSTRSSTCDSANSATDAFEAYHIGHVTTIDGAYVAGLSLTHGSPRQHIWTFAAGISEVEPVSSQHDACPCDASISINILGFVGTDYFCESGRNTGSTSGTSSVEWARLWSQQLLLLIQHSSIFH